MLVLFSFASDVFCFPLFVRVSRSEVCGPVCAVLPDSDPTHHCDDDFDSLERANQQLLEQLKLKELEYASVQEEVTDLNEKLVKVKDGHTVEMGENTMQFFYIIYK